MNLYEIENVARSIVVLLALMLFCNGIATAQESSDSAEWKTAPESSITDMGYLKYYSGIWSVKCNRFVKGNVIQIVGTQETTMHGRWAFSTLSYVIDDVKIVEHKYLTKNSQTEIFNAIEISSSAPTALRFSGKFDGDRKQLVLKGGDIKIIETHLSSRRFTQEIYEGGKKTAVITFTKNETKVPGANKEDDVVNTEQE